MYIKNIQEKLVYELEKELTANPEIVTKAQTLTLDKDRPLLGLLGEQGLFGSREWWESIREGRIEVRIYKGTITRLYAAGQDSEDEDHSKDFEYLCEDGNIRQESCLANEEMDINLYREGVNITVVYVLDKLKKQPSRSGGTNFAEVLLEISIA